MFENSACIVGAVGLAKAHVILEKFATYNRDSG